MSMTKNMRSEWIRGWKSWCRLGSGEDLEGAALEGFKAAEKDNDLGGGARPTCDDAEVCCPYATT